ITAEQSVLITATDTASQASGSAVVTLLPVANPTLAIAASIQPPYVVGATQQFTAILKNRDGTAVANTDVTFTVAGANPISGTGTTDSTGKTVFSYTGANSGTDTIQASAQADGVQVQSNQLTAPWIIPVQPVSSTTLTG